MHPSSFGKILMTLRLMVRTLLGTVFLRDSIGKILHPAGFAKQICGYQLLPESWIGAAAISLPRLEIVLGCFLIVVLWLPGAIAIKSLLFAFFLLALLINLFRGPDVDCGCFSTSSAGHGSRWTYLLRDLFFLALSMFLLLRIVLRPDRRFPEA
jgi:putative oxidoreductase